MRSVQTERRSAVAPRATEDEAMAGLSGARLLITAPTHRRAERLARRVHSAGPRAQLPFAHTWAVDFPDAAPALREHCCSCLDAAAGGSLLISAVEEMPPAVQDALIELLDELETTRNPSAPVRLISGTTVSLVDRVAAGTFSERLFYRLNIIHLITGDGPFGGTRS
jgi:DNA-binding NtrC family response regulator